MKKTKFMVLVAVLLLNSLSHAQNGRSISREEVMKEFLEGNRTIQISQKKYNQAEAEYNQTRAVYLPNVSIAHTGITTNSPLMAFGSKLNQQIVTPTDFDPALLNNPDDITNFSTRIAFQQPLINMDGFLHRKAAQSKMQAVELQASRTREYLTFEVDRAYMQLQLAYQMVMVLEKAHETVLANLTLAENSLVQGYLQRADVLAVKVRVTEVKNQLISARSEVENASNYLSYLINAQSDEILIPSDSLSVINVELSLSNQVSENRSDIKAMHLASRAREAVYKANKRSFLPRLNAFGSYELNDSQILQGGGDGYIIGAQLSWSLFEGAQRFAKSQKSKAELDMSTLEYEQYVSKSQMELNKALRLWEDAKNGLSLSKQAVEQSDESLKIRTNRFKQGLEKTSDLLIAETKNAQKHLEYLGMVFQYNYAYTYVQFLLKN